MNTLRPISIFEEEQEIKKKYGVWGILALIYLFLIQACVTVFSGIGIWAECRLLFIGEYGREGGITYLLIQEKMLMACYGVIAPLLALAIRKAAGWVLVAIIPYFLLGLCMFGLYKVRYASGPELYITLGILAGTILSLICINIKAVKRFYRVKQNNKILAWNLAALIGAAIWLGFLFYDYHR